MAPQEIVTAKIDTFRGSKHSSPARPLQGFRFRKSVNGEALAFLINGDDVVVSEFQHDR
jgi:hypothetical protein